MAVLFVRPEMNECFWQHRVSVVRNRNDNLLITGRGTLIAREGGVVKGGSIATLRPSAEPEKKRFEVTTLETTKTFRLVMQPMYV